MTLTNVGLVEFAKSKLGVPYVYGMKGKTMTQANYNYLKATYPKYVPDSDSKKVGKVCVDCSGLISWYTKVLRGSSQFKAESEAFPIASIDKAPIGVAVWRQGHIGIYIGNGEVIEARGSAYGVVKTLVKNRDFTHWFLIKGIIYGGVEVVTKEKVVVDGKEHTVEMVRKDDYTYIKTRDIGVLLGYSVGSNGKVPVFEKK